MPETIAAYIASATLTSSSVLTYGQILGLTYAATAAAAVSYGQHQRRKAARGAREAYNAGLEDRLVMTATAAAARSRVYGRVRNVDGVVFKATHGTNKEYYTLVVALAGHEVDAVETVYFNDQALTLDGDGYVQTAPWLQTATTSASATCTVAGGAGSVVLPYTPTGSVTASITVGSGESQTSYNVAVTMGGTTASITGAPADGDWQVAYQYTASLPKARVRAYTGAAGQNLYTVLEPLVGTAVQASDTFAGIACLVVTLQYDQDAFATGVPTISAVMRGAKCYDPRTTTTAWTENPAIIARDWSLYAYGGGCVADELNEPSFEVAANACDVSTSFVTDAGTDTRALYQCGIVVPLDANPDEALGEICEAMAGQWGWAGGKLSVRAGVYRAPVATITDDWVTSAADIEIVTGSTADAVNVMRPTLADAANAYVAAPAAEVRSAAYVTADGRELVRELQLGGVTRAVHAQHVAGVLMREAREGLTVTLPCNLRAYELELFDVVAVTLDRFGWDAKEFEVTRWAFDMAGGITLTLRETAAAIYTPDASFDTLTLATNTNLPRPTAVPQLTGLAASSGTLAQADGSAIARTSITWTASASEAVRQSGSVEVQYTEAGAALPSGDWPAAPLVAGRATRTDVLGLRIGGHYILRARFRNTLGMAGPWSAHLVHQVAGTRRPKVYRQTSAPSTDVADGDHWFDTDDGNKHYVRESSAWVSVRDSGIAQALSDAADAQATADGKVATWWQTTAPTGAAEGDIWFDTDAGNKQYRYTSSAWVAADDTRIGQAISDAADAQATADGKVTTFVQTTAPTAEGVGDLWLDSDDGNKLYRWSGSAWVAQTLGTSALASSAATEVQHASDAAPTLSITRPGALFTVRSYSVVEATYTNSSGGTQTVEATVDGGALIYSGAGSGYLGINIGTSDADGATVDGDGLAGMRALNSSTNERLVRASVISLADGATAYAQVLFVHNPNSGETMQINGRDCTARLTVIKR